MTVDAALAVIDTTEAVLLGLRSRLPEMRERFGPEAAAVVETAVEEGFAKLAESCRAIREQVEGQ